MSVDDIGKYNYSFGHFCWNKSHLSLRCRQSNKTQNNTSTTRNGWLLQANAWVSFQSRFQYTNAWYLPIHNLILTTYYWHLKLKKHKVKTRLMLVWALLNVLLPDEIMFRGKAFYELIQRDEWVRHHRLFRYKIHN